MKWLISFVIAGLVAWVAIAGRGSGERSVAAYSTSLAGRTASQRHNAELSAARLNGAVIAPGATFSFNRRVGTFTADAGFQKAPVSYNGSLIKDWGGGVCQTSTTLFNAALLAGLPIVERFHHRFAPSYVPPGRDAAVAFPGVDLRFKNNLASPIRIVARVDREFLRIDLRSVSAPALKSEIVTAVEAVRDPVTLRIPLSRQSRGVRASGHSGFEVTVVRVTGAHRETISHDSYPAMDRVVGVPDGGVSR